MLYIVCSASPTTPASNSNILGFALQHPWKSLSRRSFYGQRQANVNSSKGTSSEKIMPQASGSISSQASAPEQTASPCSKSFRVYQGYRPEAPST